MCPSQGLKEVSWPTWRHGEGWNRVVALSLNEGAGPRVRLITWACRAGGRPSRVQTDEFKEMWDGACSGQRASFLPGIGGDNPRLRVTVEGQDPALDRWRFPCGFRFHFRFPA